MALLFVFLLTAGSASAQQTIKGTVVDATGEPIIGATVKEPKSSNGAVTDLDGNFTLSTNSKTIEVSYVGMKTKTINIQGKSSVNVTLEDDSQGLNEVVVIGYTTVRKRDLTGAVSQVSGKQIEDVPVTNVTEALTGKMAGVNITTPEGSPEADVKIRVRGGGSLSQDNSPLYIVDGFEVASINDIAPSEIETIDVLKDAASTAIYGARGANGVVIVTTKSGKEGGVQVALNGSIGWRKMTKEVKVMDPYNFAIYQYERATQTSDKATASTYGSWADIDLWKGKEGVNYQNEVFGRTGVQHTYDVSVSGGSKDLKFNVTYAHNDQKAIMLGSDYKRDNVSAKLNAKINKWLSLDFKAALANEKLNGLGSGADTNESNAANSIVAHTVRYQPFGGNSSSTDESDDADVSQRVNPLSRILDRYKQKRTFSQTYNGGLNWKPFKGWTIKTKLQYQWKNIDTDQVWVGDACRSTKYGDASYPYAVLSSDDRKTISNTNTIQYDNKKLFGGRDRMTIILGHEWKSTKRTERENISTKFDKTATVDYILANMGAAGNVKPNYSFIYPEENLLSYFGQVLYTLNEKYLFNLTLRTDGSSLFGKGNRWGWFPAAQFAWRVNEEAFLKDVKWISNLKLRLSYGTAGNNRIPSGALAVQYKMAENSSKHIYFDEQEATALETANFLPNPDLKWETTITRNIGIDYGFWRGRVNGSLDLYWNTTKDLLMQARVQGSAGRTYQYQNFGQTSNKGIEFSANVVAVETKNFTLNANFNIAWNKNKIDKLTTEDPYQSSRFAGNHFAEYNDYYVTEGGALGEVWGYKMNGYYKPATYDAAGNFTGQAGDLRFQGGVWYPVDADGKAITDPNNYPNKSYSKTGGTLYPGGPTFECDEFGNPIHQKIGNTIPSVTGGFGIDGQWRTKFGTFDYNVFCNYSLGNKILNGTKAANAFFADSSPDYNLISDFNYENRFSWIDPVTGLNLGRPHDNTVAFYGNEMALTNRLAEINNGKGLYNPMAATKMPITDYAFENASFLRLQSVTIGYTLPKLWVKKAFIESLRIYFTAHNLATWTNYSGYDPEVDVSKNPMCPGIDYAAYPKSRSYVMGVNVTF